MIISPVNNTKLDNFMDESYSKGETEYNRLFLANEGIDDTGSMIHFLPYGAISIGDKLAIDDDNIFLRNGYLTKPGIIVEEQYITKRQQGFILGDEKYFRVIDSNIDGVDKDNLIIAIAKSGQRVNVNRLPYWYIKPESILLVMTPDGFKTSPHNLLLKAVTDDLLGSPDKTYSKGILNDEVYYFDYGLYDFVLRNEKYIVVPKKAIKLVNSCHQPL